MSIHTTEPSSASTKQPRRWRAQRTSVSLVLPALAVVVLCIAYPVVSLALDSFLQPSPGVHQYVQALTDSTTTTILIRTVRIAFIVTVVTLLLAYPYAYLMTLVRPRTRLILTFIVLLPFWTSLMARSFAWVVMLQPDGILSALTTRIGFGEVSLLGTQTGVTIAMAQVLLPFMVLPLYSNMATIDRRLLSAAGSLGANRVTGFFTVYLPMSVPGIGAGSVLVFILSLGFWVTPRLVGSPQQSVIGQLIATKVSKLLDFASAGALSVILLVVTALLLFGVSRITRGLAGGDLTVKDAR